MQFAIAVLVFVVVSLAVFAGLSLLDQRNNPRPHSSRTASPPYRNQRKRARTLPFFATR